MLHTSYAYHEIDTGDSPLVKRNPYRIPYALRVEVQTLVEEMVRKAAVEWATPVSVLCGFSRTECGYESASLLYDPSTGKYRSIE
jgi:hypothetical protein